MEDYMRGPQWSTPEAFAHWAPVLEHARKGWEQIELLSITSGVRNSALLSLTTEELVRATRDVTQQGLELTPLAETALGGGYQAATPQGVAFNGLRCAVHRPGLRGQWLDAWSLQNNETIGQLLSYPSCCIRFFEETWVEKHSVDPTPHMKQKPPEDDDCGKCGSADGPMECNILFRWLGIRLVPHLPCSFDCRGTVAFADKIIAAAKEAGFHGELDAIVKVLTLETQYTALNGVGIVSTPFFRFSFTTDQKNCSLSREGESPQIPDIPIVEPNIWDDNGFKTKDGMNLAHEAILDAMRNVSAESVLDPGCGDGTLLSKIQIKGLAKNYWGCDLDADRIERGQRRYPDLKLEIGRLEDTMWPIGDTVIFMPGRLLEISEEAADQVRNQLAERRHVIVYAYADNLKEGDPKSQMERLLIETGLWDARQTFASPGCVAAVLGHRQ